MKGVHLLHTKNAKVPTNYIHILIPTISSHHTIYPIRGGPIEGWYSKQACIPKTLYPKKRLSLKTPYIRKSPNPKTGLKQVPPKKA
jgi:hypothetical protein